MTLFVLFFSLFALPNVLLEGDHACRACSLSIFPKYSDRFGQKLSIFQKFSPEKNELLVMRDFSLEKVDEAFDV